MTLYMARDPNREFLGEDTAPDELQLAIAGCPSGYELDLIPHGEFGEIASQCSVSDDKGGSGAMIPATATAAIPDLLRCELITALTAAERTGALIVVRS